MKLYFLGTGTSSGVPQMGCHCSVCRSAAPHDKRTRTSALVETDDHRLILIDCGPDFRQQMLRFLEAHPYAPDTTLPYHYQNVAEMTDEQAKAAGLHEAPRYDYALPAIDAVLVTHEHFDHVGGLDDLRPFSIFQPIEICAEARVAAPILRNMFYCFREKRYPGSPHLVMREISPDTPFSIGTTQIVPIRVMHGKLPIVGYRISDLAYLTDMSTLPDTERHKLAGVRTMVVNALRHEAHPTHQNLQEAIAFARSVGAAHTYFVHMSHGAGTQAEADRTLPHGMTYAYDGLEIDL